MDETNQTQPIEPVPQQPAEGSVQPAVANQSAQPEPSGTPEQPKPQPSEPSPSKEEVVYSSSGGGEEEEGLPEGPGFMTLYTTLMLLLMTFFIVLVSMGSSNAGKFEKGKQSITSNFNVMGLGGSKQALYFLYSVMKIKSGVIANALSGQAISGQQTVTDLETDGGGRIFWEDGFSQNEARQINSFITMGFNIDAANAGEKFLTVTLQSETVFEKGTATITALFAEKLKPFLSMIGADYGKLIIRAYACDSPAQETGLSTPYELSALQAESIAQAIRSVQEDVGEQKIVPIGYGPFYTTDDKTTIPANKRNFVEINVYSLWNPEGAAPEKAS